MSLEIRPWTFTFQKTAFIGDLPNIAPSGRKIYIVLHLLNEIFFFYIILHLSDGNFENGKASTPLLGAKPSDRG